MASNFPPVDDQLTKALARVAALEAALQVSERLAQTASQELQYFVYAASHDLQEPLRAVSAYAQLLERMYSNDAQTSELAGFITSGVARMNTLLHNLLLYSRINQTPNLTSVKLSGAVQVAMFKLTSLVKQSGASVKFDGLSEISANEMQLCQLFEHVFSNAMLYRGSQPPTIEVTSKEGELLGEPVHIIQVRDNGCGIEEQFLSQVIQPFKRLHGKDFPGSGLGLAICDKIMRAHRGKLWLESDGQTGTSVYLAFLI